MKDDYTTNSHYLTLHICLLNVGRMYVLSLGVKGLRNWYFKEPMLSSWSYYSYDEYSNDEYSYDEYNFMSRFVLGQGLRQSSAVSALSPGHSVPPLAGLGLVHVLVRLTGLPPQVWAQADQSPHGDHCPSTGSAVEKKREGDRCVCVCGWVDGWIDGRMNGCMHGWMDDGMDHWMDGGMDGGREGGREGGMDGWMDGWRKGGREGWVHGWMQDGWMDAWTDGWMHGWKIGGTYNI